MQAELIERISTYPQEDQHYIVDKAFAVLGRIVDESVKEYNEEELDKKGKDADTGTTSKEGDVGTQSTTGAIAQSVVPLRGRKPGAVRKGGRPRVTKGLKVEKKGKVGKGKKVVTGSPRVILPKKKSEDEIRAEFHDVVMDASYKPNLEVTQDWAEWVTVMPHILENYKAAKTIEFKEDVNEWNFQSSLFYDGGDQEVEKPPIVKRYGYAHREKLSSDAIQILDQWWSQVKNKKLINIETAFLHTHGGFWCRMIVLKDLMNPKEPVSSEV